MANALARESSPYLLQHAENPVDWLPWGARAFALARERDVPVLVSIGYSACHWCHVMEHESFAAQSTAALMNERFVCVKVDREERPDVDALYMEAVQSMTGRGGWPLNVFLTPEQVPFYGGTYFPPQPRHGMPAWGEVLSAISDAWRENRAELIAGGERLLEHLRRRAQHAPAGEPPAEGSLERAVANLRASFDAINGGFGAAPKFPQASAIEFLLLRGEHEMALATLRAMAAGGIHDQLGGGFCRYSVDATWTVPHFEKMLYDNALLARAYLHGWQASDDERLREVCVDTLEWALREMRAPEGGFYSSIDADSEGAEGRFYTWSAAELRALLGELAPAAIDWLGVTEQGNFDDPHQPRGGLNVLTCRGTLPPPHDRARIREVLLAARERRERPARDDKRLTSWNALMISALADAGAALGEPRYTEAAIACAEFLQRDMRDADGRLQRSYNDSHARIGAFLEDHALLLEALLVLFETTCEERFYLRAVALAQRILEDFADEQDGGFFATARDSEALVLRRKDLEDSPLPAGSSSAAGGLLRLSQLSGEQRLQERALSVLGGAGAIACRHPSAFGHLLQALHYSLAPARGIACAVPGATGSTGSGRAPSALPARGSRPTPDA